MPILPRWVCAHWALAILIAASGVVPTLADETLTLQGGNPHLILDDNVNESKSWTVSGTAGGFSIGGTPAGSAIPFFIYGAATDNSFVIKDNALIGIGTSDPQAGLHVVRDFQEAGAEIVARFHVFDDPVGSLVISNNTAGDGLFIPKITGRSSGQNAALVTEALISVDSGPSPAIVYNAAKGAGGALVTRPLVVYRNNSVAKVTIAANGNISATSFNPVSSRSLKHDIVNLDSQKASDGLRQLTPVEFVYNDDESSEKRVGFIAEDVPEIVAASDRQSVPIMDVVALLTRVVKDQQQTIDNQKKAHDEQQKINELLLTRLAALEKQMQEKK